ncbi:hypothetical protein AB1Y20_023325 [Prymnesium parvum]|uniref:EF-hand domain-containing protein n=1 Tax=Prymnesium parvum TaxID=97485 RepID=A0AB34JGM5_PRYPA
MSAMDFSSMLTLLQQWDTDGDGLVSAADFKHGLMSLGFLVTQEEADCLCRALDNDGKGNIQIDSLQQLLNGGEALEPLPEPAPRPHTPPPSTPDPTGMRVQGLPSPPTVTPFPASSPEDADSSALEAWEQLAMQDAEAAQEALAALPLDQANALQEAMLLRVESMAPEASSPHRPFALAAEQQQSAWEATLGASLEDSSLDARALRLALDAQARMERGDAAGPPAGRGADALWEAMRADPPLGACDASYASSLCASEARGRPPRRSCERARTFGELSAHAKLSAAQLRDFHCASDGSPSSTPPPLSQLYRQSTASVASGRSGRVSISSQPPQLPHPGTTAFLRARSNLSVSSNVSRSICQTSFQKEDLQSIPDRMREFLLSNGSRVIDVFRAMDIDQDGAISQADFAHALKVLGLWEASRDAFDIDELFALFDHDGSGMIDFNSFNRVLRVGTAARTSEYLRQAVRGKFAGKPIPAFLQAPEGARRAAQYTSPMRRPRSDVHAVHHEEEAVPVEAERWPPTLRALLLRERLRIIDLFRHWEEGEGGEISAEEFRAGLHILGFHVSRRDVRQLFEAMGRDDLKIRFLQLRRQLRVAAQLGMSMYVRDAAKRGAELETAMPRGAFMSSLQGSELPGDEMANQMATALALGSSRAASSPAAGQYQLPFASNIGCSSEMVGGSLALGADAATAKQRALIAAAEAAEMVRTGRQSLQANEMFLQRWTRHHYSSLLGELRKWEVHPNGEISFDVFADSLQSIGFPIIGRWQEVEEVFRSWGTTEEGLIHWQKLRARMTGGRMVQVQNAKHSTVQYYKQASRAGEGFGNRSAPRFKDQTSSYLGPGKYSPVTDLRAKPLEGSGHSGKLLTTAPRFLEPKKDVVPGPGKYTPRRTLIEDRHGLNVT